MPRQPADSSRALDAINNTIVNCRLCPRLVAYREEVARIKRRAFIDQAYWGRPVPGWGDPQARVWVVGLAPAAHGGNRTGRVFTGDRSGDFLYAALYRAGYASQPDSVSVDDGLRLRDVYISAAVRCAPPENKPTPDEFTACRPYLVDEIQTLPRLRVIFVLGKIAFDSVLRVLAERGLAIPTPRPTFGHGAACKIGPYDIIASYHPSQRNTQTGLLTASMMDEVLAQVSRAVDRD